MKQLKFNIKDRRMLTLVLCLILIGVFTLTIAYAALNAVLTIQGSAQVSSADWDIHLANPIVKSGSATTDVPVITSGKSLTFNTTLNMPGDFYEFTVDVVNSGTIDGMIEKVTKTPELTAEQAKYLKYEVSYANSESVTSKQMIAAGVTMTIKVRVEYRNDLVASDLPTGQVVLDLSLLLDYTQSDGTGSTVTGNGADVVNINLLVGGWSGSGTIQFVNSQNILESLDFAYSTGNGLSYDLSVIKNTNMIIKIDEWFLIDYNDLRIDMITNDTNSDGYFEYELLINEPGVVDIYIDD